MKKWQSREPDDYSNPTSRAKLSKKDRIEFLQIELRSTYKSLRLGLEGLRKSQEPETRWMGDRSLYWIGCESYLADRKLSLLRELMDISVLVAELEECGVEDSTLAEAIEQTRPFLGNFSNLLLSA